MKDRAFASRPTRKTADVPSQHSSVGDNAIALAPPDYGIDFIDGSTSAAPPVQSVPNRTGMPDQLKAGIEALSGMDLSDVRVHANSAKPARLNALAYAQGNDIHPAPGQEKHLPHEAWHVVQQREGRVQPTLQAKRAAINDDAGLEKEADVMGRKALQRRFPVHARTRAAAQATETMQRKEAANLSGEQDVPSYGPEENIPQGNVEVTEAPNHRVYRLFGFNIASSDISKPGIAERLSFLVGELSAVRDVNIAITGLASNSVLEGKGADSYGLERAVAVQKYLSGKTGLRSITAKSRGAIDAPPASASAMEKARSRAVIIDITYSGTWPGITLQPSGHFDWKETEKEIQKQLTEEARERGDLPIFTERSLTGYSYRYDHIIGLERSSSFLTDRQALMLAFQGDPSSFFPFNVEGHHGERSIIRGSEYDLVNKPGNLFPLPPGRHPIRVTEVTPSSFTFTTLKGHFDTPGSTITFIIYTDANGNIHLQHEGNALPSDDPSVKFLLAPTLAKIAWDKQAENLRKWLEQYQSDKGPGGILRR